MELTDNIKTSLRILYRKKIIEMNEKKTITNTCFMYDNDGEKNCYKIELNDNNEDKLFVIRIQKHY
jgi:hypothetical protein